MTTPKAHEAITITDALTKLSEGLTKAQKTKIGSFHEFITNIWSLSFDRPELFNS